MEAKKAERVERFLREEFERYVPVLHQYQWPWERERWHELVFCILASEQDNARGAVIARETTRMLAKLGLIQVELLSKLLSDNGGIDWDVDEASLIRRILERQGFPDEASATIMTTLCTIARSLQEKHGGMIQRYLREYGTRMLDELPEQFTLAAPAEEKLTYAFSHWLQNVLNMPVPLSHPAVEQMCRTLEVSVDELVSIADKADINIALVDDWAAERGESSG